MPGPEVKTNFNRSLPGPRVSKGNFHRGQPACLQQDSGEEQETRQQAHQAAASKVQLCAGRGVTDAMPAGSTYLRPAKTTSPFTDRRTAGSWSRSSG